MPYKVVVSDHLHNVGWQTLRDTADVVTLGPFQSRSALLSVLHDADALIVRSATQVDRELLDTAPRLKVVARAGARIENIDMDAATERGILVLNVPHANVVAVAEHSFAMLLSLARQIPTGHAAVRAGGWPRHQMMGMRLAGKTLGVVGFGRLGLAISQRARAFGMRVVAYDPFADLVAARAEGVTVVDFEALLNTADIIMLSTSHTPHTYHLFDADAFVRMQPHALLVNCTHPLVVDEYALAAALDAGQIAGAALDTFAVEPPPPDHPLLTQPRAVLAPHLNQNTVESQNETSLSVVADTLDALRGSDYRNVVNLPFNESVRYADLKAYINLAAKLGKLQGQLAEGWITRVEVELIGDQMHNLVRPAAAVMLAGLLRPVDGRPANWVSAPVLAHRQGIVTAQAKGLLAGTSTANMMICRIYWEGGQRTVGGVLFANGEARLVRYEDFDVDAYPEGYMLVLENDDQPGIIGQVGTWLGEAGVNIGQWRYGRDVPFGRSVSFINLDSKAPDSLIARLSENPLVRRVRQVHL